MKKVKKHLFLLTVALVLIGCWIWKNQDKQEQIKADELNISIDSEQKDIYVEDKYTFKVRMNEPIEGDTLYIIYGRLTYQNHLIYLLKLNLQEQ
ncbi:hypothetical protein [Carnobacterium divergens]|uniref:hypothetical protein n=1 Tax=Carnobacterium divergens TaxID=2748 RepID=UPI00288C98CE|nr:hypothetical protein [Carnobacterium divergens]MDT1948763.1 hypothetical protein [Carnobacterium divergens]